VSTAPSTRIRPFAAAAVLAAGAFAAAAAAGETDSAIYTPCPDGPKEGHGNFSAEVSYVWGGGTSATISLALTCLADGSHTGHITGLALNGAAGSTGLAFVSCTSGEFGDLGSPVNAAPFGQFMAGAGIGNNWEGGGPPSRGIAVGSTETFVFTLTGSSELLSGLHANTALDASGYAMGVRFLAEGGKVVGCAVPAPGALALLAVAGIGPRRRRR
jgi:MYXO-CTERM domain-containing protein